MWDRDAEAGGRAIGAELREETVVSAAGRDREPEIGDGDLEHDAGVIGERRNVAEVEPDRATGAGRLEERPKRVERIERAERARWRVGAGGGEIGGAVPQAALERGDPRSGQPGVPGERDRADEVARARCGRGRSARLRG